jgi:hypothetical protein
MVITHDGQHLKHQSPRVPSLFTSSNSNTLDFDTFKAACKAEYDRYSLAPLVKKLACAQALQDHRAELRQ